MSNRKKLSTSKTTLSGARNPVARPGQAVASYVARTPAGAFIEVTAAGDLRAGRRLLNGYVQEMDGAQLRDLLVHLAQAAALYASHMPEGRRHEVLRELEFSQLTGGRR